FTWRSFRHHPIGSIAVLPLASLSTDPSQQFLAYGVTDELTTNLAQIRSVHVSSHTSSTACSSTQKSASQMARCLGVDALVEGSIVRSGDRVRLTVQLIDAASDRHLWAQTYDSQFTDIITTQREVTRAIAASISAILTPQEQARLSQPHPMNPEVAELYFKGSYYLSKLDLDRAKKPSARRPGWTRKARSRGRDWLTRCTTGPRMEAVPLISSRPVTRPTKPW